MMSGNDKKRTDRSDSSDFAESIRNERAGSLTKQDKPQTAQESRNENQQNKPKES